VIKGAALISTVLLVDAGPSLRAVLVDVYRALRIEWRLETAGSLADVASAPALPSLAGALAPDGAGRGDVEAADLALAESLEPEHRP
jgi:hypothetical protein